MHSKVKNQTEKIYLANTKQKNTEVAILSDKVDFRTGDFTRDKESHYIKKG